MPGPPDGQPDPRRADDRGSPALGLEAENAINRRIFDTSIDLILVVDRHGAFLRVSPSATTILGYRPDEMVGRNAQELVHPDDLDSTRREMRLSRRGRLTRNFECRYVHKTGRVVPLAWTGVWSEPEQQHFFIGRDVTERKAAEERLRLAQRMDAIGQLTGGMAHDFNNLLGVIIGNIDLVLEQARLEPADRELLHEAIDAATRGADLTRRLLAFARRQPLQPQQIAVNDLVSGIVGLLGRTLGEHIPIALNLAADVWPVRVDPAQLEASLVNLATNARDAMPGGGRLIVATANRQLDEDYAAVHVDLAPGDYAMIEVGDTGVGIPPDIAARIFEPFFTTKEPGKGTGLGLSMVFGFVKQSGGHVNVYSESNVGTTFRLYLPRDRTGASPIAAPAAGGGGEAVLVVEDNAAMRRIVRRQLTELGYRVIEADGAEAALAALEREPVALLFSDIVMPGEMNGIALARIAIDRWPGLKALLTSGFPDARLGGSGDAIAGIRLLSKPYRRAELAAALHAALDGAPGNG